MKIRKKRKRKYTPTELRKLKAQPLIWVGISIDEAHGGNINDDDVHVIETAGSRAAAEEEREREAWWDAHEAELTQRRRDAGLC